MKDKLRLLKLYGMCLMCLIIGIVIGRETKPVTNFDKLSEIQQAYIIQQGYTKKRINDLSPDKFRELQHAFEQSETVINDLKKEVKELVDDMQEKANKTGIEITVK